MSDEVIWQHIHHGHCSYKYKMKPQNFCRNPYNSTGLCNRTSCPLANSNYVTVREEEGKCLLFIKVVERRNLPKRMWEKVELSSDFLTAITQINDQLKYWPKFTRESVKQRYTKIFQYIMRRMKFKTMVRPKLVGINKRIERRLNKREVKALRAAKLSTSIKGELLDRLKQGVYGDVYNFPEKEFNEVMEENEVISEGESENEFEGLLDDEIQDIEDLFGMGKEVEIENEFAGPLTEKQTLTESAI